MVTGTILVNSLDVGSEHNLVLAGLLKNCLLLLSTTEESATVASSSAFFNFIVVSLLFLPGIV